MAPASRRRFYTYCSANRRRDAGATKPALAMHVLRNSTFKMRLVVFSSVLQRIRQTDLIYFQRTPHRQIEFQFIFEQVNPVAQLNALGCRDVARSQHHVVAGGRAQPVFLLLVRERLNGQFARLFRGRERGAIFLHGDQRIAHADEYRVLFLPILGFLLALVEQSLRVVRLRRAITNRQREINPSLER